MSYTPPVRPLINPMIPPPYGFPPMIPPPGMIAVRPPLLPPGMPPLKSIRSQSTTVFVGNISERAPDAMIKQMLQRCGNVLNWKRAAGANGKLQAFGFCEYDDPDATLRCIRLLNGYEIVDKKILVKVDQKTRDYLSEHIKKLRAMDPSRMRRAPRQAPDDDKGDINLEYIDENTLKEDRTVLNSFETIIRQYAKDLAPPEPEPAPVEKPEATPVAPVVKPEEERSRRERSPVKRRVSSPYEDRIRSDSTSRPEETEEQKERRRLERRLREKELAYRERLETWEAREQKKKYEYSIEKKKEAQRHKMLIKEAKKLKQFLEDYDDLKDDAIYFKSSSLEKKLKMREKEIESDNKDRIKEREELEDLKRKLIEKGVEDLDAEARRLQTEENNRLKKKFEKYEESSSSSSEEELEKIPEPVEIAETVKIVETVKISEVVKISEMVKTPESEKTPEPVRIEEETTEVEMTPQEIEQETQAAEKTEESSMSASQSPMKLDSPNGSNSPQFSGYYRQNSNLTTAVKIRSVGTKNTIVVKNQAFADEEEDQSVAAKKARMLQNMNMEEKKRAVKKLVESIPSDRDELFGFPIDWEQLDDTLMDKRIKPWINKKIIEYIGEEEESLNDFICTKIRQQTRPDLLLEEVKVVLDEEAELFVKKMWRLLVYETEAKRLGISK